MRKYDEEFKREALRKIHDGQSVASVARERARSKGSEKKDLPFDSFVGRESESDIFIAPRRMFR